MPSSVTTIDVRRAVRVSPGSGRLLATGLFSSAAAHAAGGLLLGSFWGLLSVIPPPRDTNSIEMTASRVIEVTAPAASGRRPTAAAAAFVAPVEHIKPADHSRRTVRSFAGELPLLEVGHDALIEPPVGTIASEVLLWEDAVAASKADPLGGDSAASGPPPRIEKAERVKQPATPIRAAPPAPASRARAGQQDKTVPRKIFSPAPEYPASALRAKIGGRVVLRVTVSAEGRVVAVSLFRSSGTRELDQRALETVRQWRFEPARRFGIAVETTVKVPVTFKIDQPAAGSDR